MTIKLASVTVNGEFVPGNVIVIFDVGDGWETAMWQNGEDTTPEPLPEPIPEPAPAYPHLYRIKDDLEAGVESAGGTRPFIRHGLPSTVRIHGVLGTVRLTSKWMGYLAKINTVKAYNYIFKPASGWHNQGDLEVVQELTFSGNVVEVTRMVGNMAFIRCLYVNEPPPVEIIKPLEKSLHPLVQMFSIQYPDHLDMSTDGRYARTLIICNPGESPFMDTRDLVRI